MVLHCLLFLMSSQICWSYRPLIGIEGETRLSKATVDASLVNGLLEPKVLSFEAVDLVVLFIFWYLESVEMTKNKCKGLSAFRTK